MDNADGHDAAPHWKANAAQADRLHGFSHDLKNRLSGLYEVARHLAGDATEDERAEFAAFAEKQFFSALRAVEQLMDDMDVPRGMGTPRLEPVDLATILREAIAHQEHRFAGKAQRIEAVMPEALPALGDAHMLEQLFTGLLSNASKFSPREAVVQVVLHGGPADAELTVTDPGVGLSGDDLANLFVRYAMLGSRSTAGEAQGRSNLARARQWAEAHGGSLEATSDGPGKGCRFRLWLPTGGR
jgi:two-component system CheB/CheR fusion protein